MGTRIMKIVFQLFVFMIATSTSMFTLASVMPASIHDTAQIQAPTVPALRLDDTAEVVVNLALERSPDIEKIRARLIQAKADAGIASAELFPSLTANSRQIRNRNTLEANDATFNTQQQDNLSFNWELDLFGANRARRRAALYEVDAVALELQAAKITLANSVRTHITQYRAAHQREIIAEQLIQSLQATLQMEIALEKAGIQSGIDLNNLRSQLQNSIAIYHALKIESSAAPLKLRSLTDIDTKTLEQLINHTKLECAAPTINSVPLAWLQQRLDVRTAEARLLSATASAKSAQAALWPNISISADGSKTRVDAGGMLGAISKSTDAFVLAQLAMTVFDGGRRRSQRDRARADADLDAAEFKSTVLLAAEETESALIAYGVQTLAASQNQAASDAAQLAFSSTQLRQKAGIDSELMLNRSQQQMLERKLDALSASRDQCLVAIDLNRAIAFGEGFFYPEKSEQH
jgi:outer membrane protein TolC